MRTVFPVYIEKMRGLKQFSQFGREHEGSVEFAAKCHDTIAALVGWAGVYRVNNDIGEYTPVGHISYAVHSLIDDVSGQIR